MTVLIEGCGAPASSAGAITYAVAGLPFPGRHNGSWILPQSKRDTLLYISDAYGVHVYSYPDGKKVGELGGFEAPEGLCSDKAGNVFVTDNPAQKVYEFAHGGTVPIREFYDYYAELNAFGCSVNEANSTLAVTSADSHDVFIFKNETGRAVIYNNPFAFGYFCSYDGQGNLYARGKDNHIAELPHGSSTFTDVPLNSKIDEVIFGIAWDGRNIDFNTALPSMVNYRIRNRGRPRVILSKTFLPGAKFVLQFTIYKNRLIGPDQNQNEVLIWNYPNIGNPVKTIGSEDLQIPQGSTISIAH